MRQREDCRTPSVRADSCGYQGRYNPTAQALSRAEARPSLACVQVLRGIIREALSFASSDPMTVAPGGLAISLGRLTTPPIMGPRLRNVKRGTLLVFAAHTDPSIVTLLIRKNRSFNFYRPMLDQTHPHTHLPYHPT